MAKYIIEIPEDTTCLNALRYEDGKCVSARSYIIPDLTPYVRSESYIDGLKEGQNEVWEFARKMISTSGNEMSEMWGCATNFGEVMHNTTYSEAKAKYDEWKKEKIRVGCEVHHRNVPELIIYVTDMDDNSFGGFALCRVKDVCDYGDRFSECNVHQYKPTGRVFPNIVELLKKMEEE